MKRYLAMLLIFATLFVFFACAKDTDDDNAVTTTGSSEEQPDATGDETKYESDDLPAGLNFGEQVINVVSSDRDWYEDEVAVSDPSGDIVDNAVYERNLAVETRLGVKINNVKIPYANSNSSTVDAVKKAVLADVADYDVVFANAYVSLAASTTGIYHNLYDVDYLDLEKSYWMQGFNRTVEFQGAQYAATGAIALSTMRFAFVTFFNKNIFDDKGIEYLYTPVREGKWTLDYQYAIIKDLYEEKNGNGIPDAGDLYGFISNDYICTDPYWLGCEVPIIGRDADGYYTYVLETEKLSNLVDKLLLLYNAAGTFNIKHLAADAEQNDIRTMFANGLGAMTTLRLMEAEHADMRNMTDLYGIVPMPKFSEAQENYHTHMHDQFTVVSVVSTVKEDQFEYVGAFLEAMASESVKTVVPAYYETALKYRYLANPESWDMLDLVINNTETEAGILYYSSLSKVHENLRTIMQNRNNSVASVMKTTSKVLIKNVETLNDNLSKIGRN